MPSPKATGLLVLEKEIFKGFLPYMGMVAILVMWPLLFVINFTPLNLWVSIWNLSSIGHVFSESFNILMELQYKRPWLKGQPWPLELIYSHCQIRENNDFGFNSFRKIQIKCFRKQIWPWHKVGQCQPKIIIWTNLRGPTSQMLHTKFQGHGPSDSREDFVKAFLQYMGMLAILVMWPEQFV